MRRRAAVLLVAAASVAAAAAAAPPAAHAWVAWVRVPVRPTAAGLTVLFHGQPYVTDDNGDVYVPATDTELAHRGAGLRRALRVPPAKVGRGLRLRFDRWVGRTATIVYLRPVRLVLADPAGERLDADVAAARVVARASDGSRVVLTGGRPAWLPSERAAWGPHGQWRTQRVSYGIQEVRVRGSNVVHAAQQRFAPAAGRRVIVRTLFFEARITVSDALFGRPVGRSIVVRYPDGHTERHALGPRGGLRLAGLPRGRYTVTVDGPGISFSRPIALSRSQDVQLQFITWLDVAVVVTALVLVAVGLALLGRPQLVRRARVPALPGVGRRHG